MLLTLTLVLLSACAFGIMSALLWGRARTAWARDAFLTEQVAAFALDSAEATFGNSVKVGLLFVLEAGLHRARFAIQIETSEKPVAVRAAVTRLEHGAFAIATTILSGGAPARA